jgi:hypothetical protein
MLAKILSVNIKERNYFEELVRDGRVILKFILETWTVIQ